MCTSLVKTCNNKRILIVLIIQKCISQLNYESNVAAIDIDFVTKDDTRAFLNGQFFDSSQLDNTDRYYERCLRILTKSLE